MKYVVRWIHKYIVKRKMQALPAILAAHHGEHENYSVEQITNTFEKHRIESELLKYAVALFGGEKTFREFAKLSGISENYAELNSKIKVKPTSNKNRETGRNDPSDSTTAFTVFMQGGHGGAGHGVGCDNGGGGDCGGGGECG